MKVVHINKTLPVTSHGWLAEAMDREKAGHPDAAAMAYEQLVKLTPLNEKAYHRLMILYRKLKEPKKELKTIKAGIGAFENLYKRSTNYDKKVIQLSKALQKATGLADKKGNNMYDPEPVARWKKRKKVVEKILRKYKM
jgi:tetratricopeptide (TPR) repeat protein